MVGKRRQPSAHRLDDLNDAELLALPFDELPLRHHGQRLQAATRALHARLASKGLSFRPDIWLSTDFFSPDGSPGFAVPFWLAHPRLERLERRMTGHVEGGTAKGCLQLLAHETAHAIQHAFELHTQPAWRGLFGSPFAPYRRSYYVSPADRSFVRNLPRWYAQSHPHEDYAETFAVWLLGTGRAFAGWPAAEKIHGLEAILDRARTKQHATFVTDRDDELHELPTTLAEHYAARRRRIRREPIPPWTGQLDQLYPASTPARPGAARHLRSVRQAVRKRALRQTPFDRYSIDEVLDGMIATVQSARRPTPERPPSVRALTEAVSASLLRLDSQEVRIAR